MAWCGYAHFPLGNSVVRAITCYGLNEDGPFGCWGGLANLCGTFPIFEGYMKGGAKLSSVRASRLSRLAFKSLKGYESQTIEARIRSEISDA